MNNVFLSPDKNDQFSSLRGLDLQDLLLETKNLFLEIRNTLNLPDNLTIGVEIEYERLSKLLVDIFINKNLSNWTSKDDVTLKHGGEITSPIMTDTISNWQELKIVCDYLSKHNADTTNNAGGHIHIGDNILGEDIDTWKHFLKLYTAYENVLFRFGYGDKISGRKNIFEYARPTADLLYERLKEINEAKDLSRLIRIIATSKYNAINFKNSTFYTAEYNTQKTIEFRSPNATTNAIIWQNNINTFSKMLISSKNKAMDIEFLDYKLQHEFHPYSENFYLYDNINLKNALEFVDLVFDNNLDKIYFLRQYLKNFENNYDIREAVKAKVFTK